MSDNVVVRLPKGLLLPGDYAIPELQLSVSNSRDVLFFGGVEEYARANSTAGSFLFSTLHCSYSSGGPLPLTKMEGRNRLSTEHYTLHTCVVLPIVSSIRAQNHRPLCPQQ